jgi:hypothetical protein
MGELMGVFEADYDSVHLTIVICRVEKKLDLVDDGRVFIVVAWIRRPELCPSELRSRGEVPFSKNCWISLLIKNRK